MALGHVSFRMNELDRTAFATIAAALHPQQPAAALLALENRQSVSQVLRVALRTAAATVRRGELDKA